MIEINRYKLCPGVEVSAYWGSITGDITDQSDLVEYINEHGGGSEAVWGSITGDITDQSDLTDYVSSALSQYATRQWVTGRGYITSSDLSGYATEDYVTAALSGYATESWVGEQGYITSSALSGYATESWVTAQSYLTSSSLKTVNNQSLVGSGDIEIGGLTPAQEEAIAPLEETSEGMLYTLELKHYIENRMICNDFTSNEYSGYLYNLGGDIYFMQYSYLYKMNPVSFLFEQISEYIQGDRNGTPLWMDKTGRIYSGVGLQLDLTNSEFDSVDLSAVDYSYNWGSHLQTIWNGQYGVYNLAGNTPQKFDEETQKFVVIPVTITQGYDLQSIIYRFAYWGVWYDGHFLMYDYTNMFELTEYEDHLEVTLVDDPYFPPEIDGVSVDPGFFFNVCGDLYYLKETNTYKLVDGVWEHVDIRNYYGGEFYFNYLSGRGVIYDDRYLIGFETNFEQGIYSVINMGSSDKFTYWSQVSNNAVDLLGSQYVHGQKTFDYIQSEEIILHTMGSRGGSTIFNLGKNTTNAVKIDFNISTSFNLNNKPVATLEDCIVNKTIIGYGSKVENVISNDRSPDIYNNWMTHTGRLFHSNGYEFNGTTWVQAGPFLPDNMSVYGSYVVQAGNSTFYVNGKTYLWDDANSEFVEIVNSAPNYGWNIWPCGDGELRAGGDYKLVNNGGTWSWESDTVQDYKYGMTYYIDGHVYVLGLENGGVYEYVESTKTYTKLGRYSQWTDASFVSCGKIFFPWNAESIYMIDFDLVDPQNPDRIISVITDIPYSNYSWFYGEYDGYTYFYPDWYNFGYCYDVQYDLPAVPSTNGTYTLQATRTGDTVTYEWVSNVI